MPRKPKINNNNTIVDNNETILMSEGLNDVDITTTFFGKKIKDFSKEEEEEIFKKRSESLYKKKKDKIRNELITQNNGFIYSDSNVDDNKIVLVKKILSKSIYREKNESFMTFCFELETETSSSSMLFDFYSICKSFAEDKLFIINVFEHGNMLWKEDETGNTEYSSWSLYRFEQNQNNELTISLVKL